MNSPGRGGPGRTITEPPATPPAYAHTVRVGTPATPITVDVTRAGDFNSATTNRDGNGAPQEGIAIFGLSQSQPGTRYEWVFWPGIDGTVHVCDDPAHQQTLAGTEIPLMEFLDTLDDSGQAHVEIVIGASVDDAGFLEVGFQFSGGDTTIMDTPIPPQCPNGPPLGQNVFQRTINVDHLMRDVAEGVDFGNRSTTGDIQGRKWNDTDGDGIFEPDDGELPLAGPSIWT